MDPRQTTYQEAAGTTPASINEAVGNVPNQAGGNPVTQSNTAHKPTLLLDGLGWPYLFFDGSDDYLSNDTFLPGSGEQPFEVTVVQDVINTLGVWLCDGAYNRFTKASGDRYQITFGSNYSSQETTTGQVIIQNVVDGTNSQLYFNGASAGPPGDAGPYSWLSGIFLGARSSLVAYAENSLWRLLIHEVLSPTARTGLHAYLNQLYTNPPPNVGLAPSFVHHHFQMMGTR